jgi:hypothetical protein
MPASRIAASAVGQTASPTLRRTSHWRCSSPEYQSAFWTSGMWWEPEGMAGSDPFSELMCLTYTASRLRVDPRPSPCAEDRACQWVGRGPVRTT